MRPQPIEAGEWRERCAGRIRELDEKMSTEEAQTVASDVYSFERTRAMNPEAAADFVAEQMNRTEPPRFERRAKNRPEHAPFMRVIMRFITEPRSPR